jgi:hypothetical protein
MLQTIRPMLQVTIHSGLSLTSIIVHAVDQAYAFGDAAEVDLLDTASMCAGSVYAYLFDEIAQPYPLTRIKHLDVVVVSAFKVEYTAIAID